MPSIVERVFNMPSIVECVQYAKHSGTRIQYAKHSGTRIQYAKHSGTRGEKALGSECGEQNLIAVSYFPYSRQPFYRDLFSIIIDPQRLGFTVVKPFKIESCVLEVPAEDGISMD